jgi:hypothetical protein
VTTAAMITTESFAICFGEYSFVLGKVRLIWGEREYWDTSVREQLLVLSSRELAFLFS